MDYSKIKDLAKKATEKTADGISSMNEMRKKAAQETKISIGTTTIRKTIEGQYYIGFYSDTPELFEFENFQFEGSTIIEHTKNDWDDQAKRQKRERSFRSRNRFSVWAGRYNFRRCDRCVRKTKRQSKHGHYHHSRRKAGKRYIVLAKYRDE